MIENIELLQVKSDRLFRDLFNEYEMDTLEWTVMQILNCSHEEIKGKVSVDNIRLNNISTSERIKVVDLKVKYKNQTILIELNNNFDGFYVRNLLYAFNDIINHYSVNGTSYYRDKSIFKVILVNLNWHRNKNVDVPNKKVITLPFPDERVDNELLKIININLDYYDKIMYNKVNKSDKLWKLLTIKDKNELEFLTNNERLLDGYSEKLTSLSRDKIYKEHIMWNETIERNLRRAEDYHSGLYDGEMKGIEKTQKEMVVNFFNNDVSIEVIAKSSGLTIEEVKEIIDKHNQD